MGKQADSIVATECIMGRRLHPNPHLCAVYILEGSHYEKSLSPAIRTEHKGKKGEIKKKA